MNLYVNAAAGRDGDGSKDRPFCRISDAARVAAPGDVVLVAPGIYRENVAPLHAGREDARITYQSTEPLGAVITGAEPVKDWKKVSEHLYVTRIPNSTFGDYNPYTTYVYGDWFFAKRDKHTGCVWENDAALYEADSLEACERGDVSPYSWNPEASRKKWYTCQDPERDETLIYANFGGDNPAEERIEITVRRGVLSAQGERDLLDHRVRIQHQQGCDDLGAAGSLPGRHDRAPLGKGMDHRGLRDLGQQVRRHLPSANILTRTTTTSSPDTM